MDFVGLRWVVRAALIAFAFVLGGTVRAAPTDGPSRSVVAVLYPETSPPYRAVFADILNGIEQGIPASAVRSYPLVESVEPGALRRWLDQQAPAVVITLGRVPTEAYEATGRKTPQVIGALEVSPQTRPLATGIGLAIDPALLFATLQLLTPEKRRVWVVYNPGHDRGLVDWAKTAAESLHLTLLPLEAPDLHTSAQQFLHVLRTADPETDALWLVADTGVVDPEAILPVIIEQSWDRRLWVFSGSLLHVKHGVLFALYPDSVRLGQRLAALALRVINDPRARPGIELLRTVKRALNLRVAFHLNLSVTGEIERQFDLVLPP